MPINSLYNSDCDLTKPGTELYSAVHVSEPAGKPLEMCKRVNVKLTMYDPSDERTIKRYISELKEKGIYLPLRGYIHSTGRGQTHKTIICLYLEGMVFGDIQKKTYHSIDAITRYIRNFSRVVVCHANEDMNIESIATVIGVSTDLVRQYLDICNRYDPIENERLSLILNPAEWRRVKFSLV